MTNRALYRMLEKFFRGADVFNLALCTGNLLTITGATNATPIVITTSAAHGLSTGNEVLIYGVQGNPAANGLHQITVLTTTTFSLDGVAGNGAYTSGGTAVLFPDEDTDTMADVTQIAIGNGYTDGGISLTGNATDFPTLTEDDGNDQSVVGLKSISFNASGGSIPASGNPALFAVLTDNNATVANREILAVFSLGEGRIAADGNPLTLNNMTITLKH